MDIIQKKSLVLLMVFIQIYQYVRCLRGGIVQCKTHLSQHEKRSIDKFIVTKLASILKELGWAFFFAI